MFYGKNRHWNSLYFVWCFALQRVRIHFVLPVCLHTITLFSLDMMKRWHISFVIYIWRGIKGKICCTLRLVPMRTFPILLVHWMENMKGHKTYGIVYGKGIIYIIHTVGMLLLETSMVNNWETLLVLYEKTYMNETSKTYNNLSATQ